MEGVGGFGAFASRGKRIRYPQGLFLKPKAVHRKGKAKALSPGLPWVPIWAMGARAHVGASQQSKFSLNMGRSSVVLWYG